MGPLFPFSIKQIRNLIRSAPVPPGGRKATEGEIEKMAEAVHDSQLFAGHQSGDGEAR